VSFVAALIRPEFGMAILLGLVALYTLPSSSGDVAP
jgi:hypothetical protein